MDVVTRPKIHGMGTSEAAWRQSPWLAKLPVQDPQQLFNGSGRVVVISPHPDDEVLGCGGLLFHAHQLGLEILVISVTDGEACYPDDLSWTRERLRAVRAKELVAAMRELGVDAKSIQALHVPDGEVAQHEAELCTQLSSLLRADDRAFVTWQADGHPDHESTGRATQKAAARCGASVFQFPIWAWHWLSASPPNSPLPSARGYRLSNEAALAKRRSLAHFASQLGGAGTGIAHPILGPSVLARFDRNYEVLLHGND